MWIVILVVVAFVGGGFFGQSKIESLKSSSSHPSSQILLPSVQPSTNPNLIPDKVTAQPKTSPIQAPSFPPLPSYKPFPSFQPLEIHSYKDQKIYIESDVNTNIGNFEKYKECVDNVNNEQIYEPYRDGLLMDCAIKYGQPVSYLNKCLDLANEKYYDKMNKLAANNAVDSSVGEIATKTWETEKASCVIKFGQ